MEFFGGAAVSFHKAALPDLCAATFPSGKARSPSTTLPKAFPFSHFSPIHPAALPRPFSKGLHDCGQWRHQTSDSQASDRTSGGAAYLRLLTRGEGHGVVGY